MDNACIVGYGVVGQATAKVFGIDKHYDIDPERSNLTLEEVSKFKYIFMCLPTPVSDRGLYETGPIFQTISDIESFGRTPIYIMRSTVFPGFAMFIHKELGMDRVISNPEFLNEATAEQDAKNPPFILLGGSNFDFIKEVQGFYEARLKGAPVIVTDNTTAEMSKLTMNAFFATKVIFANQAYDACKKLGANYETVKKVLESHPYGPRNHFKVWFNGKRGVNGRCLPKDSQAFAYYTDSELVKKVIALNEDYVNLEADNEL